MVPPRLVDAGEPIQYTRQASEARVQGVMRVQCVLTESGRVTSCRVINAVPLMEGAVIRSLLTRRYTPVLFQGRAVPVKYNFAIELKAAQ
jgi:protein TonB